MKALEKNRNRRYETANGFAMDIQRYLAGEPVLAAPPSAGYRLRKFARRHRAALTMAATILLLLITGAAVSTWQAVRATRAEAAARAAEQDALQAQRAETERAEGERLAKQDAEARRADAERQKTRAEEGFRLAHGAVDRYLAKVGSSPRLEQAGLQTLRKDLLEDAGAFYEQLIRLKSNDPAMKAELAAAFLAFANVARWNGSTQPAIERTKRALTLFEELAASNAGNETYQSNVVAAAVGLGALLSEQGSVTQAEACYKKALDIQTRLTAARPDDETRQAELASVYYGYALLCNQTARLEEAIALGERARQVYARLAAVHPGDNMEGLFKNHEAGALINLGLMYANAKRYAEAEQALDRALLLFRELSQGNLTSTWMRSGVARSLVNLGTLYMTTARPEKAETVFNQVLAIYQELAREDPEMTRWQESLAMSWGSLYSLYVSTRRPDKAQEAAEQICAVWKKLRDAYPLEARYRLQLAQASLAYGLLLQSRSRSEEAVPLYGEAIRAMQALSQKPQGQAQATVLLCAAHAMRATALNELGRFAEALEDWTRASELGKGKLTSKGRIGRAISWAGIKDHAKAVSEAKQLLAEPSMSALDVYNIGCICAIASTVAKQDPRLSEAERSRLAGTYADMAMETLRRAVKEGWSDAGHIKKDKDLDSLRERADFQQLVADLEKKK